MKRRVIWGSALAAGVPAAFASTAGAQETPKWSDIDCGQTKLVTPAGLRCRSTQEYSGGSRIASGSNAGGSTKEWATLGTVNGRRVYYYAKEALAEKSSVFPYVLVDGIKSLSPQGKGATDFSAPQPAGGGEFVRFTSATGDACVGARKEGPTRKLGFHWILFATECAPKGKAISDGEIPDFVASFDFRA